MNYKMIMTNSDKQKKEIKFNFKSLDNQFKASQIIFALNKKFPGGLDQLMDSAKEHNKDLDKTVKSMEILMYSGNLIMENCDSYEVDNKGVDCKDFFKNNDNLEEFFKYALGDYLKMVGELLGFAFETMSKSQ